jgi:formylglycine-generating enzyme required for sulfatase activity
VTWAEWDRCVAAGSCVALKADGFGGGARPVTNVSWNEALTYTRWLSTRTAQTYRLLSEAEWEYAARAGTTGRWSFGDNLGSQGSYAWYNGNSGYATHPVGTKTANAFGLFDMHGNVNEWVQDCWADNYSAGQASDGSAFEVGSCPYRVYRGGSWGSDPEGGLRSAYRSLYDPPVQDYMLGFRVARTP